MKRLHLLVALFIALERCTDCVKVRYNKVTKNCITERNVFWNFYATHFDDNYVVTITILQAQEHAYLMSYFVNSILRSASFHNKLEKTVIVRRIEFMEKEVSHTELNQIYRFISGSLNAYIILVWDEQVLSSFLDKHANRVVHNPRGKYVILFAYNIVNTCPQWNIKVQNVLARFWTEFKVVNVLAQVPCSCNSTNIYAYRAFANSKSTRGAFDVIDIGETVGNVKLWNFPLKNLNQYPLTISMFSRVPTAIRAPSPLSKVNKIYAKINEIGGYVGIDGCIIHNLAKYMNFCEVFLDTDYYKYGGVLPNGTATGSFGDVVYRKADIAGNGRFIMDYGMEVEFTTPFQNDYLCLVVPKSLKIPKWIMVFHGFSTELWLALAGTFLLCLVVLRLFRIVARKIVVIRDIVEWLHIFGIYFNAPVNLSFPLLSQKIFLAFLMSFCLIMSAIFQGSLVTSYSSELYYPDLNTLEDVAASNLPISTTLDVFSHNSSSETIRKLRQKQISLRGKSSLDEAAFHRTVAALERKLDAEFYIGTRFFDNAGNPLLHIVKECTASYFVSFAVPYGSPFLYEFNRLIGRFAEIGLNQKWYEDFVDYIRLAVLYKRTQHEEGRKVFSVNDMQTAFYFLMAGLTLACFVFVGELLFKYNYDRQLFM